MNAELLINAIVRQTMVLIAQLSTADGVRSPLSQVADQVFLGLVRELESQGLGKKVVADMFGLALRSYRQKVQRLSESATTRGISLWEGIHGFLFERGSVTRAEVLEQFKNDDEDTVRSILNDLVDSGLAYYTGHGSTSRYRIADKTDLDEVGVSSTGSTREAKEALVWIYVCREGQVRKDQLVELLGLPEADVEQALEGLLAGARIEAVNTREGVCYSTSHCLIPLGEPAGWEAGVVDHHRAVLAALAVKAVNGRHVSAADDTVGGSTLTYDIWPGHPKEKAVLDLLSATRQAAVALWDEVEQHNQTDESKEAYQVTFYCGQYVDAQDPPRPPRSEQPGRPKPARTP